ncbi:MAG: DUF11 domain-containing protein [Clostridiales bacterium]|nr:DUF11 domain-containing protein [Clostridiales bacterium]
MAIFTNQATLSYRGGVVNSNTAVGEIVEVLSMSKTAISSGYVVGDPVTYVLSVVNSGSQDITGVTITDDLGGYSMGAGTVYPLTYVPGSLRYFIGGVPQMAAPAVNAGPPLEIGPFSVPAGGNAILIYVATVNQFASPAPNAAITNTATLTGGGVITPVVASETVEAGNAAQLNIFKSLSPSTVVENGFITYTFLIENSGNTAAVATDNVVVTDLFNPILADLSVTFNGIPWVEGVHYEYNEATGLFTTTPSAITVPAADYAQDPVSGQWVITPGTATLVVSGRV